MKVILLQDVKGQGKKGDVVDVSDGYAVNFLIKKKLAEEATADKVNAINLKKAADDFHREQEIEEFRKQKTILDGTELNIDVKKGENGKFFGSITSKEIAEELSKQGIAVDKKKIVLTAPIKMTGGYTLEIKLCSGVVAKLKVNIR